LKIKTKKYSVLIYRIVKKWICGILVLFPIYHP